MQRWPGCHQRWSRSVPGVFKGTSLWLELKGKKWGSRKWNQRGNEWAASSCYFVSLQLLCWEWPIWEQRWKKGPYKRPWQYSNQGMMVAVRGEKDWVQLCTADGIFWWIRDKKQGHPTPVLLPGKSHGRRSLVGCRLWGLTESDTTEAT